MNVCIDIDDIMDAEDIEDILGSPPSEPDYYPYRSKVVSIATCVYRTSRISLSITDLSGDHGIYILTPHYTLNSNF